MISSTDLKINISAKLVDDPKVNQKIKNFASALEELPTYLEIDILLGDNTEPSHSDDKLKLNLEQIIKGMVDDHFKNNTKKLKNTDAQKIFDTMSKQFKKREFKVN